MRVNALTGFRSANGTKDKDGASGIMDNQRLEIVFKGLADINRLRILNILFQGELCGCDIQYALKIPQSNASRHLTYLKNCGLVVDRRSGYRIFYRLPQGASVDRKLLFEYLEHVFNLNGTFKEDVKRLRGAMKEGSCTVSEPQSRKTAAVLQKPQSASLRVRRVST